MEGEKGVNESMEMKEKTKLQLYASVGTGEQTNTGGNQCFMEHPGCFLPGWKATIRESARRRCVCVERVKEEKGEVRRNNDGE